MPILQGFPDLETVKFLSCKEVKNCAFHPVFYDIETTGLSKNSTFLYLIGAAAWENDSWQLYQWIAESEKEEPALLKAFSTFLSSCTYTVSYNGTRFDQPYLEARCALHKLPSPFEEKEALDLYIHLKPLKNLLKLSNMKQPSLEEFLGIDSRIYCDGKECISLYKSFLKTRDVMTMETVAGHNLEDVLGLGKIGLMLGYLNLYEGNYEVADAVFDDNHLLITLTLPSSLPASFSNGSDAFYVTGGDNVVKLIIKSSDGRFRQYYKDYKAYDYLPGEDTAIPKALSACIEKKLRKSATKDTCYTWFTCTDEFLADKNAVKNYLEHTLPYLLGTLK